MWQLPTQDLESDEESTAGAASDLSSLSQPATGLSLRVDCLSPREAKISRVIELIKQHNAKFNEGQGCLSKPLVSTPSSSDVSTTPSSSVPSSVVKNMDGLDLQGNNSGASGILKEPAGSTAVDSKVNKCLLPDFAPCHFNQTKSHTELGCPFFEENGQPIWSLCQTNQYVRRG